MNKYSGGNFDDFLKKEGIFEEVVECTRKRLLALEIEDMVNPADVSRTSSADPISTTLVQLNHYLFDLDNIVITSELLNDFVLEATELKTHPVNLNGPLLDLEELLNRYFPEKEAA